MKDSYSGMPPKARLAGNIISVEALGARWNLPHHYDLEKLWAKLDEAGFADERIPYWTELWPASLGLAQWLGERRDEIAGKICLDCGCGLGFTAITGQWLGARVVACDYEPEALRAVRESAALSHIAAPACVCMDWRRPPLAAGSVDRAWAGDIIYETRHMQPVYDLMRACLQPEGKAWFAEPGRSIFRKFIELCRSGGCRMEPVFRIDVEPPLHLETINHITVWEFSC